MYAYVAVTGVGDSVHMLEGGVGWCPLERRREVEERGRHASEAGSPHVSSAQRMGEDFQVSGHWIPRLQPGCYSRAGFRAPRTPIAEHKVAPWYEEETRVKYSAGWHVRGVPPQL